MSERTPEALFSEIMRSPHSNALRLEFSDAISTSDPDWSEHIRYAVRTDSWLHPGPLMSRLAAPFEKYDGVSCGVRRGFVDHLYVHPRAFIEHGAELLALGPILEVTFQLLSNDGCRDWNDWLPQLLDAPALRRVRSIVFGGSPRFDHTALRSIIAASDRLEALLQLDFRSCWVRPGEADEAAMWDELFASPVFRRMIDWGFTIEGPRYWSWTTEPVRFDTHRQIGDRMHVDLPGGGYFANTSFAPMPPEDRAIEQRYGYIPRLHARNWNTEVLDVLRGKQPDYPAGTPVTEEMYAVPAPARHQVYFE